MKIKTTNKQIMVGLLLIFIIQIPGVCIDTNSINNKVVLEIQAKTNTLKNGDKVEIFYRFKNLTDKEYTFSKYYIFEQMVAKNFYDKHQKKFRVESDFSGWILRDIKNEDYFVLKPEEEKLFTLRFVLFYDVLEFHERKYRGYFLTNQGTEVFYVLLKNNKRFFLSLKYHIDEMELKMADYFHIENLYIDEIESNSLEFIITQ